LSDEGLISSWFRDCDGCELKVDGGGGAGTVVVSDCETDNGDAKTTKSLELL
jgi:hypothetical protein